jgi:hypothetical protein
VEGLQEEDQVSGALALRRWYRPRIALVGLATLASALASPAAARADVDPLEAPLNQARKGMQFRETLDAACAWFEETYRRTSRGDVLLNLAECHRRQGKTASAFAEFDKAISIGAQVKFPEAVAVATQLRDDLARHLSRLTVHVPAETAALAKLTVEVDGKPLAPAGWNTPAPHDPGAVVVTAVAPGHKPFSQRIDLGADSDNKTVDVVLENEAPPPPVAPPPPPKPHLGPAPIWPWFVGGAGVALSVAAIAFEVDSKSAGSALDANCGGPTRDACRPTYDFAPVRAHELRSFGLFVGLGVAGVAAMGTAAVVLITARRPKAEPRASATTRRVNGPGGELSFTIAPTSANLKMSF